MAVSSRKLSKEKSKKVNKKLAWNFSAQSTLKLIVWKFLEDIANSADTNPATIQWQVKVWSPSFNFFIWDRQKFEWIKSFRVRCLSKVNGGFSSLGEVLEKIIKRVHDRGKTWSDSLSSLGISVHGRFEFWNEGDISPSRVKFKNLTRFVKSATGRQAKFFKSFFFSKRKRKIKKTTFNYQKWAKTLWIFHSRWNFMDFSKRSQSCQLFSRFLYFICF